MLGWGFSADYLSDTRSWLLAAVSLGICLDAVAWVLCWITECLQYGSPPGELRPSTGYSSYTLLREEDLGLGKGMHGWLGSLQSGTVYPSLATPCACLDISVCIFQLWLNTSQGSRERNVDFMDLTRFYWLKERYAQQSSLSTLGTRHVYAVVKLSPQSISRELCHFFFFFCSAVPLCPWPLAATTSVPPWNMALIGAVYLWMHIIWLFVAGLFHVLPRFPGSYTLSLLSWFPSL